MKSYIHERSDWPNFHWNSAELTNQLAAARHHQGKLLGRMQALGFPLSLEATLNTLTTDVLKTSEIEGEILNGDQVRSSVARHLGIDIGALTPADCDVEGIVEMMLDATRNHASPLTKNRLFAWHTSLFPTGRSGLKPISVGALRKDAEGPMQVVSGALGRQKVHYQAPPAAKLSRELNAFLKWFNSVQSMDEVLKSALAHLWFVTIHPFDDGNGRIARAIADMQLARSESSSQRFYSMSAQIRLERKAYYAVLERTQSASLDVTEWMSWYIGCFSRAIEAAETGLASILRKATFWESVDKPSLNERQRRMLQLLLGGFDGKLTNAKWAKITKCSSDTALRDIQDLLQRGILQRGLEGGRSTSYSLTNPPLPLKGKGPRE